MNNKKKMNNNNDYILIILIIFAVLCFLKYCSNNKSRETFKNKRTHNNNNEHFEPINDSIFNIRPINDLNLIDTNLLYIDGSLIFNKLKANHDLKIPFDTITRYTNEKDELGNNIMETKLYNKFPINIIHFPILIKEYKYKYIYIAIFNDGGLYTKNNLTDNNWKGPHRNSYYNDNNKYIPMRNLAISNEGRLLGVGYDGNIYIKDKEDTDETNLNSKNFGDVYKNEWIKYDMFNTKLIYLMLLNKKDMVDENSNQENENISYLGINERGELHKYNFDIINTEYIQDMKIRCGDEDEICKDNKLYKISIDQENKLLIINQKMELMKSSNTLNNILIEKQIKYKRGNNNKTYKNPNILYDVIHSQDGRLYGIGSVNNKIILLKQKNIYFLQPFTVIDSNTDKNKTIVIPDKYIVNYKSNYKIKEISEIKVNSLEDSHQKEVNEDNIKFKTFCRAQFPNNYIDINMLNKIDEFQKKIENLKKVQNDLIDIDNLNITLTAYKE